MLTESDVIAAVWAYLKSAGYEIKQRLRETRRGIDIIAVRGNETLRIEAKGATSSRDGSSRHGKRFNSNQALDHIAKAFYKAAAVRADGPRIGIAIPGDKNHLAKVAAIQAVLTELAITTYWVYDDGKSIPRLVASRQTN